MTGTVQPFICLTLQVKAFTLCVAYTLLLWGPSLALEARPLGVGHPPLSVGVRCGPVRCALNEAERELLWF